MRKKKKKKEEGGGGRQGSRWRKRSETTIKNAGESTNDKNFPSPRLSFKIIGSFTKDSERGGPLCALCQREPPRRPKPADPAVMGP